MPTFTFDEFPERSVSILFFTNVSNASEIIDYVRSGGVEAAWMNPAMVIDQLQILAAANMALIAATSGKMKTRNLHSELLLSLSASTNISASFKKFGIQPSCSSLIVALIDASEESMQQIRQVIKGDETDQSLCQSMADIEGVKKVRIHQAFFIIYAI
eukprot:TRINITY_DN5079_c0_g4_i1.p1 TRINITY_DN5079_c0_g4~~TRINITY_DN5079_c0_g4_i1.p1  ORF type:complete len:158 (-),score=38.23 TRINITY_DN5079_c0_g4_i1:536-1009(-)